MWITDMFAAIFSGLLTAAGWKHCSMCHKAHHDEVPKHATPSGEKDVCGDCSYR